MSELKIHTRYYLPREAASYLGFSTVHLARLVRGGKIAAIWTPYGRLYTKEMLDRYEVNKSERRLNREAD